MSTLNVDKVDPSTGTALEIGTSGDTITVPSGATFVVAGTTEITGTNNVQRPNVNPFLINGGFNVSQRYGETATSFVNNTYGLDRWKHYLAGSCALNFQQIRRSDSVVTNLQSVSGVNFLNALKLDCTTDASLGATDMMSVLQIMEGQNNVPLAGKAMTLSFWVRSNVTGTYCVAFKNGSAKTYVVEYTISSADTWEQKIINLTNDTEASYSANSSTTTNGSLQIHFTTRLGTTAQQTTADAWNTGNFYGTSNQVTWGTSTSDVFYLSGVQLEMGTYTSSTLPPFQFESYGDNLFRCQRYYQLIAEGAAHCIGLTAAYNTATSYSIVRFITEMRSDAVAVEYNSGTNYYSLLCENSNTGFDDLLTNQTRTNMMRISDDGTTGKSQGAAGWFECAAGGRVAVEDEL